MIRRGAILAVVLAAVSGLVAVRAGHQAIATGFRPTEPAEQFFAQAEPERPGMKRPGMGLMRDLNLSAEQMKKVQAIRTQYRDRLRTEREAAQKAQQELRSLLASDVSADQIRERYRQAQALREKVATTQFESMLEMREVLTLEQRKKVAARMQPDGRRFRDRMQGSPSNQKS